MPLTRILARIRLTDFQCYVIEVVEEARWKRGRENKVGELVPRLVRDAKDTHARGRLRVLPGLCTQDDTADDSDLCA